MNGETPSTTNTAARELLAAEYEREGLVDIARSIRIDEVAALRLFQQCAIRAITTALRTKQPAASEGDAEKEFFSRDFYEDAKAGKVAWPDGTYSPQANTSKHPAGDILQVLRDVEGYLTDCADVVDGDYGQPAPNREMTLLVAVQAELARLTK